MEEKLQKLIQLVDEQFEYTERIRTDLKEGKVTDEDLFKCATEIATTLKEQNRNNVFVDTFLKNCKSIEMFSPENKKLAEYIYVFGFVNLAQ